jgi:putative ABC transport system permease protein
LALAIGVGGVIAASGIGQGAEIRVAAYMREAGADLVRVRPGSAFETLTALSEHVGVEPLGLDERLAAEIGRTPGVLRSALIRRIPVTLGAGSGARAGGTSQPATCFAAAVGSSYCETAHLKLRAGRWFTPSDAGKAVAVLGSTAASQTGKPGAQVGGVVSLGGSTFTVIGLLEARPEGVLDFIVDRNLTAFVPLGSEALIEDFAYQTASTEILVQAVGGEAAESLVRSIPAILAASHPGKAIPVVSRPVGDLAELRAAQARLSRTFDLIAALALAMATLGLANLSLLRTAERSRQIGIHRALGASRWRVVRGCLGETLQLGLVGGVLGGAGAVGVLFAAAALNGWPMVFPLGSAVLAFGLGLAAGFIGGLAPTLDLAFRDPAILLRGNR